MHIGRFEASHDVEESPQPIFKEHIELADAGPIPASRRREPNAFSGVITFTDWHAVSL
jgi:hypothetical protein